MKIIAYTYFVCIVYLIEVASHQYITWPILLFHYFGSERVSQPLIYPPLNCHL